MQSTAARPAGVGIAGTGVALPPRRLCNKELAELVETSDEWIVQRTGIRERRIVDDGVTLVDLATEAVAHALQRASLAPTDLDALILATMTPEMTCPACAPRVVSQLGAAPAGAFDVSAACSGFVYSLNLAYTMVQSGFYRTVAVVGAETMSRVINWKDRNTCVLFGDAASAAILTATDDASQGCLHQIMHSDASVWHELYVPRQMSDISDRGAPFNGQLGTMQMNGREVYKFAVHTVQATIENALNALGLKPDDLAMIIPHQSNARIMESARDKLGLAPEKMYINIDRYGNTSAASAGLCLHELHEAGRLKKGDLVLFTAMGGGMTWTNSLWRL